MAWAFDNLSGSQLFKVQVFSSRACVGATVRLKNLRDESRVLSVW